MIDFLSPLAWWGAVAIVIPIVLHLLFRRRSHRVAFPSLRFLPTTNVAESRARVVSDVLLLVVRIAIIALATAALAGPVWVSAARRDSWNRRVARAVIVVNPPSAARTRVGEYPGTRVPGYPIGEPLAEPAASEAERAAFVSRRFVTPHVPDALMSAAEWLADQAPARREIVVVGDLRQGMVTSHDFHTLPASIGVQFSHVQPVSDPTLAAMAGISDDGGKPVGMAIEVRATPAGTRVEYRQERDAAEPAFQIFASASEQGAANALLNAVLRHGVRFDRRAGRRVDLVFAGADSSRTSELAVPSSPWMTDVLEQMAPASGGERDGALVMKFDVPVSDPAVPAMAARVARLAFEASLDGLEPNRIPLEELTAWARAAGPVPDDVTPTDEGDRRWLWTAALVMLVVEQFIRRGRRDV